MAKKLTKKNFEGFCDKCPNKPTCKELCGLVLDYVNQDWYDFGGYDFVNIRDGENLPDSEIPWGRLNIDTDEKKEELVKALLKDGMTYREILYHINVSRRKIAEISDEIQHENSRL